ncbi:MAG: ribbon-helix-helix protein, CopG family [Infirmifilum sp.]
MKARFGISLDAKLAEEVDRIAKATDTNRSYIINLAVQDFINEKFHFLSPHECEGVMILNYGPITHEKIQSSLEEWKNVIVSRHHFHSSEGKCVEILYVKAHSREILELEGTLQRCGCRTCKFFPCHS